MKLTQMDHAATSPGTPATQQVESHAPPMPQPLPNATAYPYSRLAGYSVLQKLGLARPALGIFWFGLALLALAVLCSACSITVGLLGGSPDVQPDEAASFRAWSLGAGGCLLVILLIPGILMLYAGRPRRR